MFPFFLQTAKRAPDCRRQFKTALLRLLPGRFVPRCKADGSYDPTQCVGSVCLCVDSRGIAVPGTSKARFIKPNCESQGKSVSSILFYWCIAPPIFLTENSSFLLFG